MDILIKGIEDMVARLLGHKTSKVFVHGLVSELVKHLFRKYEKDLTKEDVFRLIEILLGKEDVLEKVKEIVELTEDEKK